MTGTNTALNPVMWSLVYEMRISLIFPLLMILCRDTRRALIATVIILVGSTKMLVALGQTGPWGSSFWITFLWTVRMIPYFIVGILLSKHSENIRQLIQRVPERMRIALVVVPLIIFTIPHIYLYSRNDALYDIGAAMVIVLALDIPSISAILDRAALQWLGRISYSVYWIHTPILFAMFYALLGRAPVGLIVVAVIVTALIAGTLMHRFVEVPAIKLGRRIAQGARGTMRAAL
jgi:peptidoglycan/LPS O-acetylase OafA/YrhL